MTMFYKNGFYLEPIEGSVEITDERYEQLLIGQSAGQQIIANENGEPILIDPQPSQYHTLEAGAWVISEADLERLKAEKITQLSAQMDAHASAIYSQWTRFADEYRARKEAAEAFVAANYEGEPSVYITSFAIPAGLDNKTASQLILKQAAGLQQLQDALAALRMRKYELKKPDLTLEQIQSVYDEIITAMNELAAKYQ